MCAFPQGAQFGIQECVFNTDGDYTKTSGVKIFWLLFWSAEYAWIGLFCLLIAVGMFGERRRCLGCPPQPASLPLQRLTLRPPSGTLQARLCSCGSASWAS